MNGNVKLKVLARVLTEEAYSAAMEDPHDRRPIRKLGLDVLGWNVEGIVYRNQFSAIPWLV